MTPLRILFSRSLLSVLMAVLAGACSRKEGAAPDSPAAARNPPDINADLQSLQGTWAGIMPGHESDGKITMTISGNSLHFYRDPRFWFETAIILPPGKDPKQFHATIKGCPPPQADSIGEVVRAFFKIEGGTLTLATMDDGAEETSESFETAGTRYVFQKVQPQAKKDPGINKPVQ